MRHQAGLSTTLEESRKTTGPANVGDGFTFYKRKKEKKFQQEENDIWWSIFTVLDVKISWLVPTDDRHPPYAKNMSDNVETVTEKTERRIKNKTLAYKAIYSLY